MTLSLADLGLGFGRDKPTSALYGLLALPAVLYMLRARPGPTREQVLPPSTERVVLLGASSGIGKDLAFAYAKRGAQICLVARRAEVLHDVRDQCVELGLDPERILCVPADVTKVDDLLVVRETVLNSWGGFDTLHILAGVPSTRTLLGLAGVDLVADPSAQCNPPRLIPSAHGVDGALAPTQLPSKAGLDALATEARACGEINYVGTVLALATFLPLLATTSESPAVHHLSSVAAAIAAPSRCLYSATKGAALMAVESARVECEGLGVRFFSLLPGTIDNEFRTKTATAPTGGNCEVHNKVKSQWGEKVLLKSSQVVDAILTHLALPTKKYPLIPYPPFSWIPGLALPPKSTFFMPLIYKIATVLTWTPLGYLYVEPNARKKYNVGIAAVKPNKAATTISTRGAPALMLPAEIPPAAPLKSSVTAESTPAPVSSSEPTSSQVQALPSFIPPVSTEPKPYAVPATTQFTPRLGPAATELTSQCETPAAERALASATPGQLDMLALACAVGSAAALALAVAYVTGGVLGDDSHYKYLVPLLVPVTAWFVIANWVGWQFFRYT